MLFELKRVHMLPDLAPWAIGGLYSCLGADDAVPAMGFQRALFCVPKRFYSQRFTAAEFLKQYNSFVDCDTGQAYCPLMIDAKRRWTGTAVEVLVICLCATVLLFGDDLKTLGRVLGYFAASLILIAPSAAFGALTWAASRRRRPNTLYGNHVVATLLVIVVLLTIGRFYGHYTWTQIRQVGLENVATINSCKEWNQENGQRIRFDAKELRSDPSNRIAFDAEIENASGSKIEALLVQLDIHNKHTGTIALSRKILIAVDIHNTAKSSMMLVVQNSDEVGQELRNCIQQIGGDNAEWSLKLVMAVPDRFSWIDFVSLADCCGKAEISNVRPVGSN